LKAFAYVNAANGDIVRLRLAAVLPLAGASIYRAMKDFIVAPERLVSSRA
jgi:hypothetical protein